MDTHLIAKFIDLIEKNTGLHIRQQDIPNLEAKIGLRMRLLKLREAKSYWQLLETLNNPHQQFNFVESEREWQEFTQLLTVGESYFFRDQGQIKLLENQILPQLITRNKDNRILRIWSAGCSTGEEVYTLGILLKQLVPDINKWQVLILGTDINQVHLIKARQGIYNNWSFRVVTPDIRSLYFEPCQGQWQVKEELRQMVKFSYGNLVGDDFAKQGAETWGMDLILCRNVFVYFANSTINQVLGKFYQALTPGGYLLTAPTELQQQNLENWQVKIFPESVVYQRPKMISSVRETSFEQSVPVICLPLKKVEVKTELLTVEDILNQGKIALQQKSYREVIELTKKVIILEPNNFTAYYLMAQAYGNLGQYQQAEVAINQAISLQPLSAEPYYLLASLGEAQGDLAAAKNYWKRIIYLEPASVVAHLELAALYEGEKDDLRAKKMRLTALELVKKLPAGATVEKLSQMNVNQLRTYLEDLLKVPKFS